jgi:hypothetical protein
MEHTIPRNLPTNLGQFAPALFLEVRNPRIPGVTGKHEMAIAERATVTIPVTLAMVVTLVPDH